VCVCVLHRRGGRGGRGRGRGVGGRGSYSRGGSSDADDRPGGGYGGYGAAMQQSMYNPGVMGHAGMMPQVG